MLESRVLVHVVFTSGRSDWLSWRGFVYFTDAGKIARVIQVTRVE